MWQRTYTRYSRFADEEKKGLKHIHGNFETYTRYSRVADEEKKGLKHTIGSFETYTNILKLQMNKRS